MELIVVLIYVNLFPFLLQVATMMSCPLPMSLSIIPKIHSDFSPVHIGVKVSVALVKKIQLGLFWKMSKKIEFRDGPGPPPYLHYIILKIPIFAFYR